MTKNRKISMTALVVTAAAAAITAAAALGGSLTAYAARDISLNGSNFFYTANQAEIGEYEDGGKYYAAFVFADEDSVVSYRKNLAYNWFSSVKDEDGNPTAVGEEGWLSTEFSFDEVNFETFTIRFQSQQYSGTEDEVTENYVTFVSDEQGAVHVKIGEPLAEDETDRAAEIATLVSSASNVVAKDHIVLEFTDYSMGTYSVQVSNAGSEEQPVEGEFTNIGGTYARYVSSSSSAPVTPLTYSATFAEGQDEPLTVAMFSFNDNSFELEGTGTHRISDDVAPVLCLNEDITTLRYGRKLSIDFTAVDMFATSPRSTVNYYVLKDSQQQAGNLNNTGDDGNFLEVTSGSTSPIIRGSNAYLPANVDEGNNGDYTTECLVKVYVEVKDATGTGANTDNVFIDWYVPAEYLYKVTSAGVDYNFIRAVDDGRGVSYNGDVNDIAENYQQLVNEAIESQQARAGDDNYFYLPSFESFVKDNITAYRDMEFSIYYISGTSRSRTSLDYNELAIELEDDGVYSFAIYAKDAAGNDMYYMDEDGNMVTFAASELRDLLSDPAESKLADYVPVFTFEVHYGGLTVTDPKGQDIGFVGTSYSADDFEVTGLKSNYTITYTLYKFDRYAYFTEENATITYSEFLSRAADMLDSTETSKYFERIIPLDDMEKTDPEFETYSAYEWDPDTLTFIPQDGNTFYVIRMEAVDNEFNTKPIYSTMAISVSQAAAPLKGMDTWAQDNVASIVLFCVAGVAAIGIVVVGFTGRKKKNAEEEPVNKNK